MTDYTRALKQVDIFHRIPFDEIQLVSEICREQVMETGEVVFLEGAHSSDLYIILEGEVDILANPGLVSTSPSPGQEPVTIATLRRGQCFGEIALVDDGRRSATARAAQEHTRLMVIPGKELTALCQANTGLGFRLMYNLAADLAHKMRNADLRILEYLLISNNK